MCYYFEITLVTLFSTSTFIGRDPQLGSIMKFGEDKFNLGVEY